MASLANWWGWLGGNGNSPLQGSSLTQEHRTCCGKWPGHPYNRKFTFRSLEEMNLSFHFYKTRVD